MADQPIGATYPDKGTPATLGDVLYAHSDSPVPEQRWVNLVQSIAAGDQIALQALYGMAHRIVFTLTLRITANRKSAEELTIDVFHDIWRCAPGYDAANATVLGWIMNLARWRAIDRLRFESRMRNGNGGGVQSPAEVTADPRDVLELREQSKSLRVALWALTRGERQAIEMTFFAGLTHTEVAARLNQPAGIVKARLHSALYKLQQAHRESGSASGPLDRYRCGHSQTTCAYAAQALAASEVAAAETHIALCPDCRRELDNIRLVVNRFVSWPTDVLRPITTSLQARLALRIAEETGKPPVLPPARRWAEPEWEKVAPGIECKLLATDTERHRVSMLVRLVPSASYPAHTHADAEELHLLDGELWIDQRRLVPGDYYEAAPGTMDEQVRSETGCTCVLVTSTLDVLH